MSIIDRIFKRKRKPILLQVLRLEDIHHIYWDMMGGFTMMEPPTEEDYKKFKNVNIADMYPSYEDLMDAVKKFGSEENDDEMVKKYIQADVKVTEEYYKLINNKEETKMTKKQMIKEMEKLYYELSALKASNNELHNDLLKTKSSLRNLLQVTPTVTTIKGGRVYWVNFEDKTVWSRFITDYVKGYIYHAYIIANIIQDTDNYFVFEAKVWDNKDAHDTGEFPYDIVYYKVNKADGKSEKININDYKDLAAKLV